MKILVAINSTNNAKTLSETTLAWAPRAGFELRIIIPHQNELINYIHAVQDANYNHYVGLDIGQVKIMKDTEEYARSLHCDLLLELPDDLTAWNDEENDEQMIIDFAADVGAARKRLADRPQDSRVKFKNGAILKRL
jgi:hypothetical protein